MNTVTQLGCVLLVDDDQTTNHLNKRLLSRSNKVSEIMVAENGNDALAALDKLYAEGKKCDLLLLDLKMNQMDGFNFLDLYSTLPEGKKAKAVIALTSSASFYDLAKLKQYPDVREHIYKPLTETHLSLIIDGFVNHDH